MKPKEVLTGITIEPKIARTSAGDIEFDLTQGDNPVVMSIHGGIGGLDQGRVMAAWIDTGRYRILSPSRPGYLGTPLEVGKTMEQQADALAALLDVLDIDKVMPLGASAGGPPAYMFAVRHPDRVWGLIVIDGVSGYYDLPETAGPIAQAIFLSDFGQKIIQKIGELRPDQMLKSIFQSESYFTKEQMKKHIDYVLGDEQALQFAEAFMATMRPYKLRKLGTDNDVEQYRQYTHLPLEQVKCPTMIFHGTHDSDVKFYDGVYAYEHIGGAERFWVEEGSHLGFWLSPNGEFARKAAEAFMDKYRPD
jgi:pimeloyl-ACP methyl ester carboxylesterase